LSNRAGGWRVAILVHLGLSTPVVYAVNGLPRYVHLNGLAIVSL
jgi:hypothetical protein